MKKTSDRGNRKRAAEKGKDVIRTLRGKLPGEKSLTTDLVPGSRSMVSKFEIHPLAVGVHAAKKVLASILADVSNLEMLRVALQTRFQEDPSSFLLTFEPLLRRYEEVGSPLEKRPLKIEVIGSYTAIYEGEGGSGEARRVIDVGGGVRVSEDTDTDTDTDTDATGKESVVSLEEQ